MSSSGSKQSDQLEPSFEHVHNDFLLDLSFDAIVVRDGQDRITYWNQGAVETYGFSRDEALGRKLHELLHTEFSIAPDRVRELLERDGRWSGELTHTKKTGTKIVVSSSWSLKRDSQGATIAILESNREITEYRNALNVLRETEQLLQMHLENTPLAVIEWGADFRLSRWSGEAEHIFGWSAEEVLGKRLDEFRWVYEEDQDKVTEVSSGLLYGSATRSISRNRNYRKDGTIIHCEWYNSSIFDSSGQLSSILSLVLDVTERKTAEEALNFVERKAMFGIWDWHIPSGRVTWSDGCYALFEFHPTEPVSYEMWRSRVDPVGLHHVEREIAKAVERGTAYDVEYRLRLPSGTFRWINSRGEVVERRNGKVLRMAGVNYDVTARRQAEEQLWTTLESIGDGFIACDSQWRFVYINHTAEKLLRIDRAELLGKNHWEVFPQTLGTRLETEYRRAAAGESSDFESFYEPWGRWFHNRCFPRDGGGMSAYFQDITEQKQAEESLRESEAKFRTFANAIPQLCWMAEPDGSLFWYNERWYEYTGTTPEEMQGWGWQSVHDPAILPDVMRRWTAAIVSGERFEMTFPLRGRDGAFRPFLTRIFPVKDGQGNVLRWFGTNTDVTQQLETQKALRESEQRFRALVNASAFVVYRMNRDWTEMLQLDGAGFISDTIQPSKTWVQQYIPSEDVPLLMERIQKAVQSKELFEMEHRVRRVDGSLGWIVSRAVPILNEGGEIVEWFGALSDVTARKQAEEALIRSEKLASAGRMAATVAHEINNPLEAVMNLLFLAGNDPNCSPSVREYLGTADSELKRVSHITRQVLGFYRDSGAAKKVSVAAVMDEALELFARKIANKQVRLYKEYAEDIEIFAVSGELRQIFSNLIANSLDAVSAAGKIKVRVSKCVSNLGVRISIADNGGGIPETAISKIFEPFFTTKGTIGTGLGLWVTKQLVEKHGGRIRVRASTVSEHHGSTFSIVLPGSP